MVAVIIGTFIALSNKKTTATGLITNVDSDSRTITIQDNDQETKLTITNETRLLDANNHPTIFSEFNIGFKILASFKVVNQTMIIDAIRIIKAPNIIILSPKDKDIITGEFTIKGLARVFENTLQIQIRDKNNNKVILDKTVMASPLDIGLFGPFELAVDMNLLSKTKAIEIRAFQYSAKDGTIVDQTSIDLEINI